ENDFDLSPLASSRSAHRSQQVLFSEKALSSALPAHRSQPGSRRPLSKSSEHDPKRANYRGQEDRQSDLEAPLSRRNLDGSRGCDGLHREIRDVLGSWRECHDTDHDENETAEYEEKGGKVQEVYAGEPVNHGSARQVRLVQLEHQPREAEHKTSPQRCQRSLAIETGEEDTEQEAGGNRRGDVGLHALQIDVELGRDVLHEWDPDQPKENQDH